MYIISRENHISIETEHVYMNIIHNFIQSQSR